MGGTQRIFDHDKWSHIQKSLRWWIRKWKLCLVERNRSGNWMKLNDRIKLMLLTGYMQTRTGENDKAMSHSKDCIIWGKETRFSRKRSEIRSEQLLEVSLAFPHFVTFVETLTHGTCCSFRVSIFHFQMDLPQLLTIQLCLAEQSRKLIWRKSHNLTWAVSFT